MNMETVRRLIEQALEYPPAEVEYRDYYKYAPYYHLMYLVVKEMVSQLPEPKRLTVVELGMDEGRGAASFAAASSRADVYGIDRTILDPPLFRVLEKYPNIKFLNRNTVPARLYELPPIDILHIDTDHTYDQFKEEYEAYVPGLAPGAVILLDDLHDDNERMMEYFNTITWPKISDDRLHSREHFIVDKLEGYGVVLAP